MLRAKKNKKKQKQTKQSKQTNKNNTKTRTNYVQWRGLTIRDGKGRDSKPF